MKTLEVWIRCQPAADLSALHRTWWVRWTYGPQEGLVLGRTCACPTRCRDFCLPQEFDAAARRAIAAGMARAHAGAIK